MDKKNDHEIDKLIEENPNSERLPKKAKIILGIIIPITILLVIALIIVIIYYQKKLSDKGDDIKPDPTPTPTPFPDVDTYSFFGNILYNLTYDNNSKIENSFKIDGYNHIDGVDNINDNKDYEKNERNIYNLYMKRMKEIYIIYIYLNMQWIERTILMVFCYGYMEELGQLYLKK